VKFSEAPSDVAEPLAAHAVEMMVDPTTGMPFYVDAGTGKRLPAEGLAASTSPTANEA
jgi:hypothetical protein